MKFIRTFLCKTCNQKFEAEGVRVGLSDPIYDPCSIAHYPCNVEDCKEFRPLKTAKRDLPRVVQPVEEVAVAVEDSIAWVKVK